jgi:multidrug efflux pump subunit AcrB
MWLLRTALRRPITVIVAVTAIALCSVLAVLRMRVDIFPDLNLPVIYVAQPYGGLSPEQMEGYISFYYEYHFLYINGIESVVSKSIQGNALLKLTFHPGTDMSQALAQTISYVNRAHAFMPYGTVPPFVIRFDAGTVPVGYLVFSSQTRTLDEIQDLALNRVRPVFATLPGVSSPPPFGGSQRTIVVTANPEQLRSYGLSPQDVVQALTAANTIIPAGNANIGNSLPIVQTNSVVTNIQNLLNVPLRTGAGPTVFLGDVATVSDSADVLTGYALVNGKRAVYIPVTKRPDASTLTVVNEVKQSLARFRALVPPDIQINYEFDQSAYVKGALYSVMREGLIGAGLVGLLVLFFLGDWRSSLIVVLTIPFALLGAVVGLWISGQTINIMTLGGLALAVGILVDEGTVVIENIHTHLALGQQKARAVLEGVREVIFPNFLSVLCVLAVFVPSFFMTGVARALFVPLSLAVGFAMAASFLLSNSMVPVISVWLLRVSHSGEQDRHSPRFERFQKWFRNVLQKLMPWRWALVGGYGVAALVIILLIGPRLGRTIFPSASGGQFRLRFDAPPGTRVELTEQSIRRVLDDIRQEAGPGNVDLTLGYVGTQGSAYPINTVYLWTSGPQEAVINVALNPSAGIDVSAFEERLRKVLPPQFPGCHFSFEAGDLVSQIMNFGAPTPVEVSAMGPSLSAVRGYVATLYGHLTAIRSLRDLEYEQPLSYPSVNVDVNRELAGQFGVTAAEVAHSVVDATYSSRFVTPLFWRDPNSGVGYQVQLEIPQSQMSSVQDIENIPVMKGGASHPLLGDVAQVSRGTVPGELDRENGQWMVTLTANMEGEDLGRVATQIRQTIAAAGPPPRGVIVDVGGQIAPMEQTFSNLGVGLLVAVLVVFYLLAANFESMRLALVVISTVPAVICGVILMLLFTGTTLNVQSFMGAIMAVGVAVANAILLVTFAEQYRRKSKESVGAAIEGARSRLRPVLMTSLAMIIGMVPMALALGGGAEATAPLGRAVIGGLLAATFATLVILPSVFAIVQRHASTASASLDPDDPASAYSEGGTHAS